MRLFTAIDLPECTLRKVERLLALLRPEAQLSWSPIDNLHITTTFIGEWPAERLDELTAALTRTAMPQTFDVELQGIDYFPGPRQPKILYLGVQPNPPLTELAHATAAQLNSIGLTLEARPYTPHLTLARIRRPTPLTRLQRQLAQLGTVRLGQFPVSGFKLYQSQTASNGSIYRPIATFSFPSTLVKCAP